MKIVVTGGAGFVGSNLIEKLLQDKKKFKIISIDNYSTGSKKNHKKNKRVKYLKNNTVNIEKIFPLEAIPANNILAIIANIGSNEATKRLTNGVRNINAWIPNFEERIITDDKIVIKINFKIYDYG